MNKCLVCGEQIKEMTKMDEVSYILLLDKRYIHKKCLDISLRKLNSLNVKSRELKEKTNSISSYIIDKLKGSKIHNELENTMKSIEKLSRGLDKVFTFYPDYPPDWQKRRKTVLSKYNHKCSKCHRYKSHLHVHHKIALSKGGSNALNNLNVLCEDCHLREHNQKSFSGDYNKFDSQNKFINKHQQLEKAIKQKSTIFFNYWKYDKSKKPWKKISSIRHVRPSKIGPLENQYKTSRTGLYLYAYDLNREDNRCFNISHMSNIKI